METVSKNIQDLQCTSSDKNWGITITTIGIQNIPPYSTYPSLKQHPSNYFFNPEKGRILSEYQLIYISSGSGYFESSSCKKQKIEAGTIILLFPNEWHTYHPDNNGWSEYWVGFKGDLIEQWTANHFFSKEKPIYKIGINSTIINLYEEIASYASTENIGYQQLASSIVLHLMGEIYFKDKNKAGIQSMASHIINEAKYLMKKSISSHITAAEISLKLNVSYSWFRSHFKAFTGSSPTQYMLNLKYLKAKELLTTTDMNISDIAYALNFESISHFSKFFVKKEGLSPTSYRRKYNMDYNSKNKN